MDLEVLLPSRVTVVTAPAGFGKTSYVARLRSRPGTVWVDAGEPVDPLPALRRALDPPGRRVLVVDRADELEPESDAARLIARALDHPVPTTRIALLGRPPLPWPVAADRSVTRVTERELGLHRSRIGSLLEERLGPAAAGLTDDVAGLTGGWPALVGIAVDELGRVGPAGRADALVACFRRGGAATEYVEAAVLSPLSDADHAVLRLVARVGATPVDTLVATGVDPGGRSVDGLLRRHLLVTEEDRAGAVLTRLPDGFGGPLGRALLMAPVDQSQVLRRLAAAHGRRNERGRELDVLALLGDHEQIAALLSGHGHELLREGRAADLLDQIHRLPAALADRAVRMLQAQALQVLGDHDRALECYRALAGDTPHLDPGLAWRMGVIHYLNGEPAEARECYRRGRLTGQDTAEEAQLLAWTASAEWIGGDAEACGDHARRALAAASASGDDAALASAHVAMALHAGLVGVRRDLNEHYDRAFDHAERAGDRLQLVRVCANRGSHLADEGHLDRALRDLDLARRTASEAHFVAFEALCAVNTGTARLRLGELGEAEAAFAEAQRIYQRMGSRKIAYALNGLGEVHLLRGATSLARTAFAESVEVSANGEDVQALAPALCGLAAVLAATDRDAALAHARRAAELPGPTRTRALLTWGWLVLDGQPTEADRLALEAEDTARRHRDWVGLAECHELQGLARTGARRGRALREAELAWRESGSTLGLARLHYARGVLDGRAWEQRGAAAALILERYGVDPEAAAGSGLLAALPRDPGGRLEVQTLGGFALLSDGRPLSGPIRQSRKARDLVKLLAARDGPMAREELMETLWPGQDVALLGNRLAVAVTAVRRSADPEHRHPPGWFLVSAGDTLALDHRHVTLDVRRFLAAAEAALALEGRAAVSALEVAIGRYRGDFLADEPYADWATPMRSRARLAVERCRARLSALSVPSGSDPTESTEPTGVSDPPVGAVAVDPGAETAAAPDVSGGVRPRRAPFSGP